MFQEKIKPLVIALLENVKVLKYLYPKISKFI